MFGEALNLTSLNPKLDLMQLGNHVLTGVLAGYLLWWLAKGVNVIRNGELWLIGSIFGLALWPIVLTVASMQGKVTPPWQAGLSTVVWTMFAFAVLKRTPLRDV